jgi:hypothetical protein
MGAKPLPAQELTPEHRTGRERRRLHDAVNRLVASRIAHGFPAKVEDPTVLARIAAIVLNDEREQRSHGAVDD